ncbi:MAG TPA: STAS domain-containing protein [Thermoanaerobaculia bacterium]|jgi:anti-anti-sigma factor|nr:STAS domain-containing protein [Thermoanaerobaculia bacterium]
MKLRVDKQDAALVLALEGELDVDGSVELEERCLYEQQEGARHFVFSLSAVTQITGPGLRVLLGLARSLPRSGGSLVLCELEQRVEEALRVSGLDGAFVTAPSRAAALERSREIQSARREEQLANGSEAQQRIDLAIALLGSAERPR